MFELFRKWNVKRLKLVSGVWRQTDDGYYVMSPQYSDSQFPRVRNTTTEKLDHYFVSAQF
jgi:hypothetical protein